MGTEVMATKDMVMAQATETVIIVILMAAATIITVMDILIIIIIITEAIGMADGMEMGQGQGQVLEVGDKKIGQGGRILL